MANDLGNVSVQPYWLKTPDFFEIPHERMHHNEAVYAYGEMAMFVLNWNALDFAAGIVQKCPECSGGAGVQGQIAAVFQQPSYYKCPVCFGSTFFLASAVELGGIKARIVRPCLWDASDETQKLTAQGVMTTSRASLQSISDFRLRTGDYVFKADGSRWRIASHETNSIISGFQASTDVRAMIGYVYPDASREDEEHVSYLIPPSPAEVTTLLDMSVIQNYPMDFSTYEVVNGPLISTDFASTDNQRPPVEGD